METHLQETLHQLRVSAAPRTILAQQSSGTPQGTPLPLLFFGSFSRTLCTRGHVCCISEKVSCSICVKCFYFTINWGSPHCKATDLGCLLSCSNTLSSTPNSSQEELCPFEIFDVGSPAQSLSGLGFERRSEAEDEVLFSDHVAHATIVI